jgi:hypothetical protein
MGTDGMLVQTQIAPGIASGVDVPARAATSLKISLLCEGRPIVQVSFPAYAIVNLPDLVPDEIKPRIVAHSLELEQLAATFAARGCPQGELFTLPGPDGIVRAWME